MSATSGHSFSAFISSLKFIKKTKVEDNGKLHAIDKTLNSPLTHRRRSYSSGNLLEDCSTVQGALLKPNFEFEKQHLRLPSSGKIRRKSLAKKHYSSSHQVAENVYHAIVHENIDILKQILSNEDFDINALWSSGWTPFHHACRVGNTEILKLFADAGANINILAPGGLSPLRIAATCGNFDAALFLIKEKGVNCKDIRDGIQQQQGTHYSRRKIVSRTYST